MLCFQPYEAGDVCVDKHLYGARSDTGIGMGGEATGADDGHSNAASYNRGWIPHGLGAIDALL